MPHSGRWLVRDRVPAEGLEPSSRWGWESYHEPSILRAASTRNRSTARQTLRKLLLTLTEKLPEKYGKGPVWTSSFDLFEDLYAFSDKRSVPRGVEALDWTLSTIWDDKTAGGVAEMEAWLAERRENPQGDVYWRLDLGVLRGMAPPVEEKGSTT